MTVEEIAVSKLREAKSRIAAEGEKLAGRLPPGAHAIFLDARGKGMTSEDFAEMLAAMRDAGARDLVFLIGGPDGLDPGPCGQIVAQSRLRAADLAASDGARDAGRADLPCADDPGRPSLSSRPLTRNTAA